MDVQVQAQVLHNSGGWTGSYSTPTFIIPGVLDFDEAAAKAVDLMTTVYGGNHRGAMSGSPVESIVMSLMHIDEGDRTHFSDATYRKVNGQMIPVLPG